MRHSLSSKFSLALTLVAALAFPQIGSAAVIFSDDFNAGTPGANLNGSAVQYSSVGAKTWSSHSVYQGGTNTFAANGGKVILRQVQAILLNKPVLQQRWGKTVMPLARNFYPLEAAVI